MTAVTTKPLEPGADRLDSLPRGIDLKGLSERTVIPLRHPLRWVIAAIVVILLLNAGQTLFTNPSWEWAKVPEWFFSPAILKGLQLTLLATAISAVVSFVGGIVVALGRLSGNPVLSTLSWLYIWAFRSLPLILVLIFLFNLGNLYPAMGVGVPFGPQVQIPTITFLSPLVLGVIGLSLSEIAYSAEVVRSGILAVDQGQHEAAKALGLPQRRQFLRIVLPQALRSIVPAYVNQIIGLIKASSLLFYVSLLDLFGVVQSLGSTYPTDIIPLLIVATLWYLILTSAISVVQYYIERFYARGSMRELPPTPLQRVRRTLAGIRSTARGNTLA
ncbi:amino acid ABC transporter permease [Herbiconiux sp. CPCC 203407]|uniref:Amino acid ABC transporter permease n=1 Tax=Herbiconiux oxytropis TaxID=2970915 RepID=A0AA42BWR7_9MICO|nr:amino acid ABC transporter permease [Herbiconiux oxytropis]MCS5723636.1 amino acid ABC transporter permease [Herbiconiux oxytropis]MCS5726953.1 amino acid ABC transporter permease [Herbiconiux oxytropis]